MLANWLNTFGFGVYPYIALSIFILVSIIRFDREPYTWKSSSSQLLRTKELRWGSVLFHYGVIVVLCGHFVGLLMPLAFWPLIHITLHIKQMMVMIIGGAAGVMAWVGIIILLHRRLFDARIRKNSSFWDITILIMLFIQLCLGLSTLYFDAQNMSGAGLVPIIEWVHSVVLFHADPKLLMEVPLDYRIHIAFGMTILLVAPFTRLVHIWSAPVWYLFRKGWQVVRSRHRTPAKKA